MITIIVLFVLALRDAKYYIILSMKWRELSSLELILR